MTVIVNDVIDSLDSRMTAEVQPRVPEAYRAGYRRALRDVREAIAAADARQAVARRVPAAHGALCGAR